MTPSWTLVGRIVRSLIVQSCTTRVRTATALPKLNVTERDRNHCASNGYALASWPMLLQLGTKEPRYCEWVPSKAVCPNPRSPSRRPGRLSLPNSMLKHGRGGHGSVPRGMDPCTRLADRRASESDAHSLALLFAFSGQLLRGIVSPAFTSVVIYPHPCGDVEVVREEKHFRTESDMSRDQGTGQGYAGFYTRGTSIVVRSPCSGRTGVLGMACLLCSCSRCGLIMFVT